MPYFTDEKLKNYLDTNQLHREQMCRAVLAVDKKFSDVRPRQPRGGPDDGRDIQAIYREDQKVFGAVSFVNQANDSNEQKIKVKKKFSKDLISAISADKDLKVFVFFTNINLTTGEKDALIAKAKRKGILYCEILDRERIRITLDSPDGFSIRFQFLSIPLSEAEQASFFSRWGDDIQSIISSGFQKVDGTLNRILFLQEANDPISHFTLTLELKKKFSSEEIGHFRLFSYLTLKEPKHNIISILFGSSDKSNRMREKDATDFTAQQSGIKYGISFGQWEQCIDLEEAHNEDSGDEDEKWTKVGCGSSVGRDQIEFLSISYSKSGFIRYFPVISLRDLDDAMFILLTNMSLAEKVREIHVYAAGYKLREIDPSDIKIDATEFQLNFPIEFDENEIKDQWVRIRPKEASFYQLRFFDHTPKRLFTPSQIQSSLDKIGGSGL